MIGWHCVVYKRGGRVLARAGTGRIITSSEDAGKVIRRAIEHAAGRGSVFAKGGTYPIATAIEIENVSNILVQGASPEATKLVRITPKAGSIFHLVNVSNVVLRGLWLDGGGMGNQILDIFVQLKRFGYGNILVERCKIGHNSPSVERWGVTVWGYEGWANPNTLRDVTFRDCVFYDMPSRKGKRRLWDQVTFSGVSDVLMERCLLENVNMVYFMICHCVTMRNCTLKDAHRITVDGGEGYRFENLTGGELDYIHLHGCERRPVRDVVISGGNIRVLGFAWVRDVVVENLGIHRKRAMPKGLTALRSVSRVSLFGATRSGIVKGQRDGIGPSPAGLHARRSWTT